MVTIFVYVSLMHTRICIHFFSPLCFLFKQDASWITHARTCAWYEKKWVVYLFQLLECGIVDTTSIYVYTYVNAPHRTLSMDKSFSIDGGTCTRADDGRFVGVGVLFFSVKKKRRIPREGNICRFSRKRTCACGSCVVNRFGEADYVCAYVAIKFTAR